MPESFVSKSEITKSSLSIFLEIVKPTKQPTLYLVFNRVSRSLNFTVWTEPNHISFPKFWNPSNFTVSPKQIILDTLVWPSQVFCTESGYNTFYLNTALEIVGTSRDSIEKRHPVYSVTLDVSDLTLWIYVTLIILGIHRPRFTVVSWWFPLTANYLSTQFR